jgi:two-component system, OmpR family, alkaline phosphatase synthesis response regulator PhoP
VKFIFFDAKNMKTILVVDDELKIVKLVRDYLERGGFGVRVASDGKTALSLARTEKPDLIILDLGLPQLDGLDVTRELRKASTVPVIMLTGRSEESDKLIGLELGADDYVTKPFSPKELVARVRVVLRRVENASTAPEVLHAANLTLDLPRMRVSAEGREIEELTPSEFGLLAAMVRYPGRVFTRAQLLDAIHGVAFESYERAIDAHIKNIRHKIEPDQRQPRYILTVYGVGYKFADQ